MKKLTLVTTVGALALAAIGCSTTANTNANMKANGANVGAVVVNSNQAPITNAGVNTNANTTAANKSLTREDYDKNKDKYTQEAKTAGAKIGTGLTDGYLWAKAKAELALVEDLRDSTINVDVDNAVVTLRGSVATQAQKDKAATAAKVDGVTSVKNELTVKPADSLGKQVTGTTDGDAKKSNTNK